METENRRAVIALDMEWNQPVPWRTYHNVPESLKTGEIIQIGAVRLGAAGEPAEELRLSVRPKYYKEMHWKVKKLTHLDESEVRTGLSFPEAMEKLGSWLGEPGSFDMFAWGSEDERMLAGNLQAWGLNPDWFPENIYDLRLIYDGFLGREATGTSLTDAAAELGAELELDAHDSLNDAKYLAAICERMDLARGIEQYEELDPSPAPGAAFQRLTLGGFSDPFTVLTDEALRSYVCPACGRARLLSAWVTQNKERQIGLQKCSCGAESYLRLRRRPRPDGTYLASRAVFLADEAAVAYYGKKYKKQLDAQKRAKKARERAAAETAGQENGSSVEKKTEKKGSGN